MTRRVNRIAPASAEHVQAGSTSNAVAVPAASISRAGGTEMAPRGTSAPGATLSLFSEPEHTESPSTDAQCTPRDLALDLGIFALDVCSNPRSHIRSLRSYMLERGEDGLSLPWALADGVPCSVWCNGPYSDPLPWCERLRAHTAPWCSLWKLDTTTAWFAELMAGCDGWAPFRKRLAYERPGNCGSANFASVLVWGGGYVVPDAVQARLWMRSTDLLSGVGA